MSETQGAYLVDERSIAARLGIEIQHPIRIFTLDGLGINKDKFLADLAPTFVSLPWDTYDVKRKQVEFLRERNYHEQIRLERFLVDYYADRSNLDDVQDLLARLSLEERRVFERIKPRRKRSIARFIIRRLADTWGVERVPALVFSQNLPSDDVRTLQRRFKEASLMVTEYTEFFVLLQRISELVASIRPVKKLEVTLHQVSTFADVLLEGDNSPEGIHQDGADYIVSALVMERDGIVGGESVVYGPDKRTEYVRRELQPGEGLFQADKNSPLWHDVTLIHDDPATPAPDGKRSIFGFDIDVLE